MQPRAPLPPQPPQDVLTSTRRPRSALARVGEGAHSHKLWSSPSPSSNSSPSNLTLPPLPPPLISLFPLISPSNLTLSPLSHPPFSLPLFVSPLLPLSPVQELDTTLNPEIIPAVEDWLSTANPKGAFLVQCHVLTH